VLLLDFELAGFGGDASEAEGDERFAETSRLLKERSANLRDFFEIDTERVLLEPGEAEGALDLHWSRERTEVIASVRKQRSISIVGGVELELSPLVAEDAVGSLGVLGRVPQEVFRRISVEIGVEAEADGIVFGERHAGSALGEGLEGDGADYFVVGGGVASGDLDELLEDLGVVDAVLVHCRRQYWRRALSCKDAEVKRDIMKYEMSAGVEQTAQAR
jgi:hypothetical protein